MFILLTSDLGNVQNFGHCGETLGSLSTNERGSRCQMEDYNASLDLLLRYARQFEDFHGVATLFWVFAIRLLPATFFCIASQRMLRLAGAE